MTESGRVRDMFATVAPAPAMLELERRLKASETARAELSAQIDQAENEIADLRLAANQRLDLLRASDSERRHLLAIAEERLDRLRAVDAECQALRQTAEERLQLIRRLTAEIQSLQRRRSGPPGTRKPANAATA